MATDSAARLSWEQALAWRMRRHHLVERAAADDLPRVVGDIGGLHAQLMSSAELSLWARIHGLAREAVHEALWTHRSLVKLWVMRGTLHLLPAFDPWVAGASRGIPAVLEPAHRARVYRPQGWISPVVLVNGRMAGVWRHTARGGRVLVEIEPFGRLPAWAGAHLEAEAERLAAFLGGRLSLTWQG